MSHETIYKTLFIQSRGALKKKLLKHLRMQLVMCRGKSSILKGKGLEKIPNTISISERLASVEDRAVPAGIGKAT